MAEYPVPITEALLGEITRRIVEAFNPEKVILFGSRAAGTPRADSDVDLLVVMDAQTSPIQRAVAVKRVCRPRFVAMDVLVKTPEEMATQLRQGNSLLRQILAEGRVLYERHS
jgi:predicted nucleotidyltransferase